MYINYVLLGFYLCRFRFCNSVRLCIIANQTKMENFINDLDLSKFDEVLLNIPFL